MNLVATEINSISVATKDFEFISTLYYKDEPNPEYAP